MGQGAHTAPFGRDLALQNQAAAALATYDADNSLWAKYKTDVAAKLVSLNPDSLKPWKDAFRPVSKTLIDPLSNIYRNPEHDEFQRSLATSLLADYVKEDVKSLSSLICDADERQFEVELPSVSAAAAVTAVRPELLEITAGGEVQLGLVAMRVREHTRANEQLHQYLATLPVPVVAWLRDTQNYVQLAAHGLTLWDVAPSRVERDRDQWTPLTEWLTR